MTAGRTGSWSDGGTTDGELLAGTADRLRWRAPELTLVFARQAATRADEAKDRALALRANALMVAALVRLGKHAEAVEPAVSALREAETAGERELAGSVRVDLAASTRAVGLTGSAFVLVRPMLEGSDTRPAVRAGALAEIVGGLAQAGQIEVIDEVLFEADRLYAADDTLSGDVRRILRALLCARIASFRRRWGNATGAVAAATEGMTLLDGLSDPGTDSGQARAELGLEMVSALLDAGEEAAAIGQADQTLNQPVRATSAAAIGRLMLILATRVHFPAGRAKEAHALLAEIVRVARRHELDGLLADVLTSLAYAQEADGELTEALNSLRSARAAEQRRLRADTLARLIVLEELGAGTRLPDDTESLLRRVVRTPARSNPEALATEVSSREAASREMSGRELAGRGIGPGPRPRPNRGAGTYDSVGYERTGQGTEDYDLPATASQDHNAAASQPAIERYGLVSQDYGLTYDLEGYPTLAAPGYDLASSLGVSSSAGVGDTTERAGGHRSAGESADTGRFRSPYGSSSSGDGGSGTGTSGGGGGEGGGGGAPGTDGLAASGAGGRSRQDILGRELAGWEMVARERAAMDLAGQTRAGSDLVAADRDAPEWAGADPAAVDRVVGRAAVDSAAVDLAPTETESDWAAKATAADTPADTTSEQPNRPKGRRSADADKPKWPDAAEGDRDEETGLLNRQGLRRRLAAARRQAWPTALTLVRLEPSGDEPEPEPRKKDPDSTDRFSAALIKAIDTAGAGRIPPEIDPDVLTSLADHVRDMAPRDAELARPDEGELAVLLPDTTRDEAEQFAATLRETVSASDWDLEDPARGVSVSTGVAQYQEGTSEDALLSAAREDLTSTDQDTERPDWQSVEPLYDLPSEDSGYTFIQEYAGLPGDGQDQEMAEYLAGFPLPDYGRQWPSAEEPGLPEDDGEGGRSVLDRLDITRGSGGRRRAQDALNAGQSSDFEQYAIKQPMESYSNTGDEILAAAEEAERASIPQVPEPDEVPTPPDNPEVPIPPDPDVEPQPGRRRAPEPDDDPLPKPSPRPRFPTGPDIPAPEDPDADPDPRRRRWTSDLDPENPRARRRALPRDPSRRAVESDDDPESTGRRRMPEPDEVPEARPQEPLGRRGMPEVDAAAEARARPGESTGRRRMPVEGEVRDAGPGEPTGQRRMPGPDEVLDARPEESLGRRRMPEGDEVLELRARPGESTGRRRMPEGGTVPEAEPTGRRRMPEGDEPAEVRARPGESTGRRRVPEPFEEPELSSRLDPPQRDVGQSTVRRRMPEWPDGTENQHQTEESRTASGESTGRRRMPDAWPSDPEPTGRRRMPDAAAEPAPRGTPDSLPGNEIPNNPGKVGRRRKSDFLAGDQRSTPDAGRRRAADRAGLEGKLGESPDIAEPGDPGGRRRMPDAAGPQAGRRHMPDARDLDEPKRGFEGRRRMLDSAGSEEARNEVPGPDRRDEVQSESTGRRRMPPSRDDVSDEPGPFAEPSELSMSESLGLEAILGELVDREPPGHPASRPSGQGPDRRGQSGLEAILGEAGGREQPGYAAPAGPEPSRAQPEREAILGEGGGRERSGYAAPGQEQRRDQSGLEAILGETGGRERPGYAASAAPEQGRGQDQQPWREAPNDPEPTTQSAVDSQNRFADREQGPARPESVGLDAVLGDKRSSGSPTPPGRRRAPEPKPDALPPQQSGPVDDFPTGRTPEVFSLGPDGLSKRAAVTESSVTKNTEPVEEPIQQPDESPMARRLSAPGVDELSKRRQTDGRPERPRRRVEPPADGAVDDRPSRLRRRERTDLKLADLLAEALVAYQSSTSEGTGEDVLSAYQDADPAPGEDTERHRGETGY